MSLPTRRWNYFKDRLTEQFGCRVYKIGVDAGFDCPNRDGTKARGGCAYCSQEGSFSPYQDAKQSIVEQIRSGRDFVVKRYRADKFIIYFQAFTNTYASVEVMQERFESALMDERIVGLSIATRPDCIDEEKADYLAKLAASLPFFTVELGLQSVYQNRLDWVNRHETIDDYIRAMKILNARKIKVITHVILGFPGESQKDMSDTVRLAEECGTQGIKLQMLHVIKGTKLAWIYQTKPFKLMEQQEYLDLIYYLMERLDPKIEIHRITGETERSKLLAPDWVRHKTQVFDWIEKKLERERTFQGRLDWHGHLRNHLAQYGPL